MSELRGSEKRVPVLDESGETLHKLRKIVTDQSIDIIISSGDSLFRDGLTALVDQWEEFRLLGATDSLETARKLCTDVEFCVCIIDTSINAKALGVVKSIREKSPLTKIIIISAFGSDDDIIEALRAGIHGYCIRELIAADRIRGMIWGIVSGAVMVYGLERSKLPKSTQERASAVRGDAASIETLSKREREVLLLLAQGLTNAEIGARLYLSEATVKKNISRIVSKLQVDNRVQAAVLASKYIE